MKNNFKYLITVLVSLLFLTACEEDLLVYEPDSTFAQLASSTASTMSEGATTGKAIKVVLGAGSNTNGATFDFNITGDSARFTVSPSNGKVEFGAGSYEATITVTPVDNSISDGNADLTISLTGENIGVGGDGIDLTSVKLTIIDDDCPIVIDDTALWTAQYLYSLTGPPATEIALTKVADNQWYLPTTWGYNAVSWLTGNPAYDGLYVFDAVITLNPADLTCTIEGTSGLTPGGDTGSYDPCANTFTFSSLNDELFSGGGIDAGFTLTGK
tara:strand:- start:41 stop:853 length:813 start_codon:yes stop_codon:yes gene_type:complete